MRPFEYIRPASIDEAVSLLAETGEDRIEPLAGGTDLLTLMKADIAAPQRLMDIKRLDSLPRGIEERSDGVALGALTTLSEIERSPLIQRRYTALAEAASLAATPQLRNMGTLGGNLLQRPRCWYFRSPLFHCWLKGGDECQAKDGQNQLHALFGGGPCYAVHPSDLVPTLLAFGATVCLRGPQGERALPLAEFFALPEAGRRRETVIRKDELLLDVHLPALAEGTRSTYLKAMERKMWAFALVGVAAVVRLEAGRIEDVGLVLSGVAPIPWDVSHAAQVAIGAAPDPELFEEVAARALENAEPLEHNQYKVPLTKHLIQRALAQLA